MNYFFSSFHLIVSFMSIFAFVSLHTSTLFDHLSFSSCCSFFLIFVLCFCCVSWFYVTFILLYFVLICPFYVIFYFILELLSHFVLYLFFFICLSFLLFPSYCLFCVILSFVSFILLHLSGFMQAIKKTFMKIKALNEIKRH